MQLTHMVLRAYRFTRFPAEILAYLTSTLPEVGAVTFFVNGLLPSVHEKWQLLLKTYSVLTQVDRDAANDADPILRDVSTVTLIYAVATNEVWERYELANQGTSLKLGDFMQQVQHLATQLASVASNADPVSLETQWKIVNANPPADLIGMPGYIPPVPLNCSGVLGNATRPWGNPDPGLVQEILQYCVESDGDHSIGPVPREGQEADEYVECKVMGKWLLFRKTDATHYEMVTLPANPSSLSLVTQWALADRYSRWEFGRAPIKGLQGLQKAHTELVFTGIPNVTAACPDFVPLTVGWVYTALEAEMLVIASYPPEYLMEDVTAIQQHSMGTCVLVVRRFWTKLQFLAVLNITESGRVAWAIPTVRSEQGRNEAERWVRHSIGPSVDVRIVDMLDEPAYSKALITLAATGRFDKVPTSAAWFDLESVALAPHTKSKPYATMPVIDTLKKVADYATIHGNLRPLLNELL